MGLRCLLGHDFGPSGVVREHEEDGSEMVVTERELRRCRRCGEEQILSESTEVRAIRREADVRPERRDADAVAPASSTQGADVGDDTSPLGTGAQADSSSSSAGDGQPAASTPDTDALRTAAESVTGPGDDGPASASETAPELDASDPTDEDDETESDTSLIERAEAGFDEPADPDEEDAVILDDDEDEPERERGAWPDSGDVGTQSRGSAPDGSSVDSAATESPSAADEPLPEDGDTEALSDDADEPRSLAERAAEEDAELMGSASEHDTDGSETQQSDTTSAEGEGAWPAHDGEDQGFSADTATAGGPGMAYGNELTPDSGTGSVNGRSRNERSSDDYETSYLENTVEQRDGDGTIVSAGASESRQPSPGVETEYYCPNCGHTRPLDSSLRTGDICPECQQGYIAERER